MCPYWVFCVCPMSTEVTLSWSLHWNSSFIFLLCVVTGLADWSAKMLLLYIFLRQKEIFKFLCVIGLLPVKRVLEFLLTEALLICCKILSVVEQLVLWEVLCVAIIYVEVLHFFSSISLWPHLPWLYSMPYLNIYVCAKPFYRPKIPLFFFYFTEDRASIRTIYLYCKFKLFFICCH